MTATNEVHRVRVMLSNSGEALNVTRVDENGRIRSVIWQKPTSLSEAPFSFAYEREVESLAAERGMRATELDPNVWMFEAADDMGDWAIEQDEATLEQRLAAGRLQASGGAL